MGHSQQIIFKKTLSIFSTILFYAIIFFVLIFTIANIQIKQNSDIANVFGSGFLSVQSDSMNSEQQDSFASGDVVLVKMLDQSLINELKVGDIVTYYDTTTNQLITHRIIEIYIFEETIFFQTQGDDSLQADIPITADEVLAVYQSSITGLGASLDYLQSPKGFAIFIIFPVLVILLIDSVRLFKNLSNFSKIKSEARVKRSYKRILKSLENETNRIRHQIMSNWITEVDYEKIVKLRM